MHANRKMSDFLISMLENQFSIGKSWQIYIKKGVWQNKTWNGWENWLTLHLI